jgi:flagella basal body P-ring formation protein FlgA
VIKPFSGCAMALALSMPALAGTQSPLMLSPLVLSLRDSVTLDHPALLLGDLVEAAPGTDAGLLALPLGPALRAGQLLRLRPAELETRLRSQRVLPPIAWQGASAVRVQTRSQHLAPQLLREAAAAQLDQAYPEPADRIELALPETAVEIPQRPYRLRVRPVDARGGARVLVWLDVLVDDAVYRSVVLPAMVTRMRMAWVARRALAGGGPVDGADFELRQVNAAGLGALPEAPVSLAGLAGTRLRGALREGQVLTMQALAPAGAVLRGDRVRLTLHAGALELEAPGVAQASAVPGERVAVRAASSGASLAGRVDPAGNVVIE